MFSQQLHHFDRKNPECSIKVFQAELADRFSLNMSWRSIEAGFGRGKKAQTLIVQLHTTNILYFNNSNQRNSRGYTPPHCNCTCTLWCIPAKELHFKKAGYTGIHHSVCVHLVVFTVRRFASEFLWFECWNGNIIKCIIGWQRFGLPAHNCHPKTSLIAS